MLIIVGTSEATCNNIINSARAVGIATLFSHLNVTNSSDKEWMVKAMAVYDSESTTGTVMYSVDGGSLVNI